MRDQPGGAAVDGDEHGGAPAAGQLLAAGGQRPEVDALALQQPAVADRDPAAVDGGDRRRGRGRSRSPRRAAAGRPRGRRRARTIACGQRVLGLALDRGGQRAAPRPRRCRRRATSVTSGSPLVRVPVLSITTVSIRAGGLQRGGVLEQHAALGAEPGADHDRGRGGQAERVRAGDHHDGDREQQRRRVSGASDEQRPRGEGQRRRRAGRRAPARTRPGRPAAARGPWSSAPPAPAATIWASAVSAPTLVARTRSVPFGVDRRADDLGRRAPCAPAGSRR